MIKYPEILAPAGSMETLSAALKSGADAVYVGGKKYSARSSAANFDNQELKEAAELCHKYGAKLFLAVNTVISDDEAEDFLEYIRYASEIGTDAFIVQDWGAAEIIKTAVPDAVIHASTQMSVHTKAGTELLKDTGFVRVVPARELSRETIKNICSVPDMEKEVFAHGALCMSVSGQCYMSAVMGSRSANRGCCGQACRLPFSAVGNREKSSLSLKDLSLLPEISELVGTGVDSLKIEGRMKRPEYVAAAVSEMYKALNGQQPDMSMLKGIFSRSGFTDGYFKNELKNMFGVREKEDVIAAKELIPKIHEIYRFERAVHSLGFSIVIQENKPVELTAESCGISVTVQGECPQKAQNRPTDFAMAEKQLSKLGDTVFSYGGLKAEIGEGLFVPAGQFNELRRKAVDELTSLIIKKFTPVYHISDKMPELPPYRKIADKFSFRAVCEKSEQAFAAAESCEYVAVPLSEIKKSDLSGIKEKIIISPPRFILNEEKLSEELSELYNAGYRHILCHTPDHIAIGRNIGFVMHGSYTLNLFNSYSAEKLRKIGLSDCCVSFELKLSQIEGIRTEMPLFAAVYGKLPLMLTRNCPIKNEVGCGKCTRHLIDRTGREYPVMCNSGYVEILNPDILFMTDRLDEIKNISGGIFIFHDENAAEVKEILSGRKPSGKITRGLYYRGVS